MKTLARICPERWLKAHGEKLRLRSEIFPSSTQRRSFRSTFQTEMSHQHRDVPSLYWWNGKIDVKLRHPKTGPSAPDIFPQPCKAGTKLLHTNTIKNFSCSFGGEIRELFCWVSDTLTWLSSYVIKGPAHVPLSCTRAAACIGDDGKLLCPEMVHFGSSNEATLGARKKSNQKVPSPPRTHPRLT